MTVRQVADRLVELCRAGQIMEAYEELYHADIRSTEPEGFAGERRARGKVAVMEKLGQVAATVEKVHETTIGDPIVAADHFALRWRTEMTYKKNGGTRGVVDEIAVYRVTDGKITAEQFFYAP